MKAGHFNTFSLDHIESKRRQSLGATVGGLSITTRDTTHGLPVMPDRELGLPRRQQVDVGQPPYRPLCRGLPWASIRDQPRIIRTATPVDDRTLLTLSYKHIPGGPVISNRQGSLTTRPAAGRCDSATIRPAPNCTANYSN